MSLPIRPARALSLGLPYVPRLQPKPRAYSAGAKSSLTDKQLEKFFSKIGTNNAKLEKLGDFAQTKKFKELEAQSGVIKELEQSLDMIPTHSQTHAQAVRVLKDEKVKFKEELKEASEELREIDQVQGEIIDLFVELQKITQDEKKLSEELNSSKKGLFKIENDLELCKIRKKGVLQKIFFALFKLGKLLDIRGNDMISLIQKEVEKLSASQSKGSVIDSIYKSIKKAGKDVFNVEAIATTGFNKILGFLLALAADEIFTEGKIRNGVLEFLVKLLDPETTEMREDINKSEERSQKALEENMNKLRVVKAHWNTFKKESNPAGHKELEQLEKGIIADLSEWKAVIEETIKIPLSDITKDNYQEIKQKLIDIKSKQQEKVEKKIADFQIKIGHQKDEIRINEDKTLIFNLVQDLKKIDLHADDRAEVHKRLKKLSKIEQGDVAGLYLDRRKELKKEYRIIRCELQQVQFKYMQSPAFFVSFGTKHSKDE